MDRKIENLSSVLQSIERPCYHIDDYLEDLIYKHPCAHEMIVRLEEFKGDKSFEFLIAFIGNAQRKQQKTFETIQSRQYEQKKQHDELMNRILVLEKNINDSQIDSVKRLEKIDLKLSSFDVEYKNFLRRSRITCKNKFMNKLKAWLTSKFS